MRHWFHVFSDDPTTLRGFILDRFSHLLILFELTQNLRSCFKIASENSRFLRGKCKGFVEKNILLLEPDVWGLNWKVRICAFFSKILCVFFGCNPSLITNKKGTFSQLQTPRIHKPWTWLSLQLLLGLLASCSQVHPQWCCGRWDLAGKKLPERKEPENKHFLPFWGDERIQM